MKELNMLQIENLSASGEGQDFVAGILCGIALGATGFGLFAIVGCVTLFGDW